jgi:TonB family protein
VKQPKEDAKKPAKPAKDTKEEVKKTPEKPKKLTAEDIRSNSKVVKNEPPKKPPRGGGGPIIDPNKLLRDLKNNGVYQPPGGGGGPIGEVGDPNQNDAYFASVSKFLYNHWQQPGKALLGNTKPSVDVRVNVAANGQIISATIVGRSGNQIMDISVEKLFAEIRVLPVPPKAMEFTIKMMIIDD